MDMKTALIVGAVALIALYLILRKPNCPTCPICKICPVCPLCKVCHKCSKFQGCYKDECQGRALPTYLGETDPQDCNAAAKAAGYTLYGTQFFDSKTGKAQCFGGSNMSQATECGQANNCTTNGNMVLGGWNSNAIYNVV